MSDAFHFPHLPNNTLLHILREPEFASALAYSVDFKNHENLKVVPKEFSIELFNDEISISIIVYSGFEGKEFEELKNRVNVHLICFGNAITTMWEFENLEVKIIDKLGWMSSVIARSERDFVKRLESLKTY